MKILHTSDWHLGRTLEGMSLIDDQRHVLQQIVSIAHEERPDVIVIAGDLYDRSMPPADAVELFDETVTRFIVEEKIPVIIIGGNHDSPERMNVHHRIVEHDHLHIAGAIAMPLKTVSIQDEYGDVVFYLAPYTDPEILRYETDNEEITSHQDVYTAIAASMNNGRKRGERSVLVGHAFVAGGQKTESERQLAVGGAECIASETLLPFHYTALGHLHMPQNIAGGTIRYSGSILKYSLSEVSHVKSVTICMMDEAGAVTHRYLPLVPKRDMHKVSGSIIDRTFHLDAGQVIPAKEDFLHVVLTKTESAMDVMRIIQESFPNTLALDWQREQSEANRERSFTSSTIRQMNPLDLFKEFFRVSTGDDMDEEQTLSVHRAIQELDKGAAQ